MNTESPKMMDMQAFITLLDGKGSNKATWPAELSAEAEQLLAHSAQARAELQAAQALDQLVAAAPEHLAPSGLHARILTGLPPESSKTFDQLVGWLTATFWRPAALALAPLLLGIWLGSAVPAQEESSPALDLTSVLLDEVYSSYD